jgi:predicted DsbA family dithiol-disulfide isomerase
MRVDIWSDVICPWCYVGRARFDKALSTFDHRDEVEVVYHAFELDPSYPKDQHETSIAMLSRKYGMSEADARAADSRVAALAAAEGLGFDPERPVGNTFDIHRADSVREDEAQAGQLGISGVPFFAFDMALGVSGGQATQTFTSALNQAWERRG